MFASPLSTSRPSRRSRPRAGLGRTEPPTAADLEKPAGREPAGGPPGAPAGGGGGHHAGRALSALVWESGVRAARARFDPWKPCGSELRLC